MVDLFGGLVPLQKEVGESVRFLRAARSRLASLEEEHRKSLAERDLAVFQREEISRADLRSGEEEELEQEQKKLAHSERLREICQESEGSLYSDQDSIVDRLGQIRKRLQEAGHLDPHLSAPADLVETAMNYLDETAQNLRQYKSTLDGDPSRLEQIQERLSFLHQLKRKYRATIDELLSLAALTWSVARPWRRSRHRTRTGVEAR